MNPRIPLSPGRTLGAVLSSFLVTLLISTSLSAAEPAAAANVRKWNNAALQLLEQYRNVPATEKANVRSQAAVVLQKRAAALQALIKSDPQRALTFAFSPELLADLQSSLSVNAIALETHVKAQGTVERWTYEMRDKTARTEFRMTVLGQSVKLHFAGRMPNVDSDQEFEITGVAVGDEMAVSEAKSVSNTSALIGHNALSAASVISSEGGLLTSAILLVAFFSLARLRGSHARLRATLQRSSVYILVFAIVITTSGQTFAQSSSCSNVGSQKVAVLLVTFPGVTPPSNITQQSVHDMFFSTTGPSLDGYWREVSYGQTWAEGDVFGWYTLDSSYADCGRMDLLRDAAITAASNAGVDIQNYSRIFIVSTDFGCGWTGLSQGRCTTLNSPAGSFVASSSVLDASWIGSQSSGAGIAAHEGGHNLGIAHAQLRTFGTEPLGPIDAAGTILEYGDHFSDMSSSNLGHYAAPHKAQFLGWLATDSVQAVQTSGTYTIAPYELSTAGPQTLKVQRGSGNTGYYLWIEYRQPLGNYDTTLMPAPQSGALVHYQDPTTGATSQLLDFTPATSTMVDSVLLPGSSWKDPYSDLSLSVVSATSTALTVNVSYSGAVTCLRANPTLTLSPLNPSIYPGASAAYGITITNNDSSACSSNSFTFGSSQPSGWSTAFTNGAVSLAPGQSASLTMTKTGPSSTPPGTYAVDATGSSSSYAATGDANVTVMPAATTSTLAASLSTSSSTYTRKSSIPLTVSVTYGGKAASGAAVTFVLTKPDGTTVSQTASTSTKGTVTWSYRPGPKSPTGTYTASAQASYTPSGGSSQTVSTNTVSFAVK